MYIYRVIQLYIYIHVCVIVYMFIYIYVCVCVCHLLSPGDHPTPEEKHHTP